MKRLTIRTHEARSKYGKTKFKMYSVGRHDQGRIYVGTRAEAKKILNDLKKR